MLCEAEAGAGADTSARALYLPGRLPDTGPSLLTLSRTLAVAGGWRRGLALLSMYTMVLPAFCAVTGPQLPPSSRGRELPGPLNEENCAAAGWLGGGAGPEMWVVDSLETRLFCDRLICSRDDG